MKKTARGWSPDLTSEVKVKSKS